jgi:hypothetical protein
MSRTASLQDGSPPVSERLTSLAGRCAIGLPVTWVRLNCEDPFDVQGLEEATTLALDTEVPSWQWSSWLLRECMLERLIG